MVTLEEIQLHIISLRLRVILENLKELMSSQDVCRTAKVNLLLMVQKLR